MLARRHLLAAGTAFVAGLAAPFIRSSRADAGHVLRLGHILPVQSQLGAGATVFADEVARRTSGRITAPAISRMQRLAATSN